MRVNYRFAFNSLSTLNICWLPNRTHHHHPPVLSCAALLRCCIMCGTRFKCRGWDNGWSVINIPTHRTRDTSLSLMQIFVRNLVHPSVSKWKCLWTLSLVCLTRSINSQNPHRSTTTCDDSSPISSLWLTDEPCARCFAVTAKAAEKKRNCF